MEMILPYMKERQKKTGLSRSVKKKMDLFLDNDTTVEENETTVEEGDGTIDEAEEPEPADILDGTPAPVRAQVQQERQTEAGGDDGQQDEGDNEA